MQGAAKSYPSVSIVVPTYKEAESLPLLLDRLGALRASTALDFELLIMDDNSRDGTTELIASRALPWVQLVVRTADRGLSPSVVDGFKRATKDVVVVMDADLSHPPERIPDMLDALAQGNEFVIGSRYVPGASTDEAWGVFRWLNSKVATVMARPFTTVRDPMSGFFAFRRSMLERADPLNAIGYKIGLEVLVKSKVTRAAEVPIHFAQRQKGESKLSFKEQVRYIQHLERLFHYKFPLLASAFRVLVDAAIGLAATLVVMTGLLRLGLSRNVALGAGIAAAMGAAGAWRKSLAPGLLASLLLGGLANALVTLALVVLRPHLWPQVAAVAGALAGAAARFLAERVKTPASPAPPEEPKGKGLLLLALGPVLALVGFASGFLPQQTIWVDETTQLKGLTLSPVEATRWLAGADAGRFGVPPDRMPPFSYLVGAAWSSVFGLTETSLRWMGVVLVALAAYVVGIGAGRLGGPPAGVAAGLAFACSPNVVTTAVEIRAYPLFLLTSACAFAAFLRILREPRTYPSGWAAALTAALAASMYTHFYGLLLATSIWSSALLSVWSQDGRMRPLLLGAAATGLGSLGLVPFVRSSVGMSGDVEAGTSRVGDVGRLAYRFFGHPTLGTSRVATVLALAGAALLLLLALRSPGASRRTAARSIPALAGALAAGFLLTAIAGLLAAKFDALKPSYSVWMLPGLSILLASVFTLPAGALRTAGLAAMTVFVGAQAYASVVLDSHGRAFSHGPYGGLAALLDGRDVKGTVVVHDRDLYGVSYFPLFYGFGSDLRQVVGSSADPDRVTPITFGGGLGESTDLAGLKASRLLIVRTHWMGASDLRDSLRGSPPPRRGPLAEALDRSSAWRCVSSERIVATAGADVDVLERR